MLDFVLGERPEECVSQVLESYKILTTIGKIDQEDLEAADTPFKIPGFAMPEFRTENAFKNFKTLDMFRKIYFLTDDDYPDSLTNSLNQTKIMTVLVEIVKSNPINYFQISSRSSLFLELIEGIDIVGDKVKVKIMG